MLFGGIIRFIVGESSILAAIVSLVATVLLFLLLFRINWEKIVEDLTLKGWRVFLKKMVKHPLDYVKK